MIDLLTIPEVAAKLRVKVSTLRAWRVRGTDPPSVKIGRRVLYRADAVDQWVAEKEATQTRRRHDQGGERQ